MSDLNTNVHEAYARLKKATALADQLQAASIGADLAEELDTNDWTVAAECAGVNTPSILTCREVIALLRSREAARV